MRNGYKVDARPTHKELTRKIRIATELLINKGFYPAELIKLDANFRCLNLFTYDEQFDALRAALREICATHYKGVRPPAKSYEPKTLEDDLFSFAWESDYFGEMMYFKFCLHQSGDDLDLYVFSLHKDRSGKKPNNDL